MVKIGKLNERVKPIDLIDEQWAFISPLIPIKAFRENGKGRLRINNRAVINGILWVLRTGT